MNGCLILAQAAAPGPGGQSTMFLPVMMFIAIGFMFYMQIRAQRRKDKERKEMLGNIKTGDRVLFSGGIIGVITNAKDKTFTIRVADNTKIQVLRAAVTSVLKSEDLPDKADAEG